MTRYRIPSFLAALAVAAPAVALPAAPARAHTELTRTEPAARSTTTTPVAAVTLTFSGLVKSVGATVRVTGSDNASYSDGAPRAVDSSITQRVRPLPVGAISVTWRVTSADGHPIQGRFTFTNRVTPPTPTAAATTPPPAEDLAVTASPAAASRTSGDEGSSSAIWWVVLTPAVLVVALVVGLLLRRRRPAPRT